ncbi:MAG: DUF5677 domain-containing protein [Bacilli bacterium]|jgi:hypothetical protein|nr:DUF5677 domain-containing protein [Bacilli bacterium]
MSKKTTISHNFVRKFLEESNDRYPHSNEKLTYFCTNIKDGYTRYKANRNDAAGIKTLEQFAIEIIHAHNAKIKSQTENFKCHYFRQEDYILKIINDKCESLINKNDPTHIFTYVNPQEDPRVDRLKEIINFYYKYTTADTGSDVDKLLAKRIINQMISGVRLISVKQYADAFIIWRSLLENVSYLKILDKGGKKTSNLFAERKNVMKKVLRLSPSTTAEMESLNEQARHQAKSATWWEQQRFVWAKHVVNIKDNVSAKSLQKAAGLGKYYPHYQVASIFTHEYLFNESDFKIISLPDYIVNLYWRAFDEIRSDFKRLFSLSEEVLEGIKKYEEALRLSLKAHRDAFEEFTRMIS